MASLQIRKTQANAALVTALEAVVALQTEEHRDQAQSRLTALETQNTALETKNTELETKVAALEARPVYSAETMKRLIAEEVETQVKKRIKIATANIGRLLNDNSDRIVEEEEGSSSSRRSRTVTPRATTSG